MASTYNTVTVTDSATLIIAANVSRRELKIANTDATVDMYIGMDASVTTSNGFPLYAGQSMVVSRDEGLWLGPVYGIVASGSIDARYWEADGN